RVREAKGPYRDLSRRGIRRELLAEDQDRGRGACQNGRQSRRRHRGRGEDRANRRRQDLRRSRRTDGAHPHRRNQRISTVRGGDFKMTTLAKFLFGVVAALVLAALYHVDPALAQDAAAEGAEPL